MSSNALALELRRRVRSTAITPPETPSIALAVSPATRTINPGETVTYAMTITRGGGYAGEGIPTVLSLPPGVALQSFAPTTFDGPTAVVEATLVAAVDAPPIVGDLIAFRVTGVGVAAVTQNVSLTVAAPTALVITSVAPSSIPESTPTAITIVGDNFDGDAAISIGGVPATSVVVVDSTTITCTTPSLAVGSYDVVLTQASGTTTKLNAISSGVTVLAFWEASVDFAGEEGSFDKTKNGIRINDKDACAIWDTSRTDAYSMKINESATRVFRFNWGGNVNAECRYTLGDGYPEIFLECWIYQPDGTEDPFVGVPLLNGGGNDKFHRIWNGAGNSGQSYGSGNAFKLGASTRGGAGNPGALGNELTVIRYYDDGVTPPKYSGMGEGGTPYATRPLVPFWGVPEWSGRWVRLRQQYKCATAANNDGIIRIWADDTVLIERTNCPVYPFKDGLGFYNSLKYGYFFGWRNSGTLTDGRLYMDHIKFTTGGFE